MLNYDDDDPSSSIFQVNGVSVSGVSREAEEGGPFVGCSSTSPLVSIELVSVASVRSKRPAAAFDYNIGNVGGVKREL